MTVKKLLITLFVCVTGLNASNSFGYISYMTTNIGDDIQAIAAKRLLPEKTIPIDREFIGVFNADKKVPTLINGWFMHSKNSGWYRDDIEEPNVSWPPSSNIDPFIISIHFWHKFIPEVLTVESINYLKKHAPIGARDKKTLQILQDLDIPSYFSGCLTLTLDNPFKNKKREKVIYAVDLSKDCLEHLKKQTRCKVVELSHGIPRELYLENNTEKRHEYVNGILNKYRRAKCVVTSRLHVAMPCLAFETPILYISPTSGRVEGLRDLTNHCTTEEFLSNSVEYNFIKPPKNPRKYLKLREALLERVNTWVDEIIKK